MKSQLSYIKHTVVPCFLLSGIAGILTGALVFLFKLAFSAVSALSGRIYSAVRADLRLLPFLILGASFIGAVSASILKYARDCRGGGIPTAVASIRALIPMRWVQGVFVMFASAMITYLGGVPLGNEGPSVQMGTAVGKGTTVLFGKKNHAWQRYAMTGGAAAGFASATCAPLTGILFALEEVHRRFSPMILMASATAVLSAVVTQDALAEIFSVDVSMFSFEFGAKLSLAQLPMMIILGLLSAVVVMAFTVFYKHIHKVVSRISKRISLFIIIISIFVLTAAIGFASPDFIGSGHSLIHKIFEREGIWYMLLLAFLIRGITMISANTSGISGGVFLPILTFGAIIGALFGEGMLALGFIDEEAYPIIIAAAMTSFWGVSSRTPLTAIAFAAEVLCGVENILPIAIAVTVAYVAAEMSGISSFSEAIMEKKIESERGGKVPLIVDTHLSVCEGSFAVGRDVRDIIWPPTCVVLSVHSKRPHERQILAAGDVLHIHYASYFPDETRSALCDILGERMQESGMRSHMGSENHTVPVD